MAKKSAQRFCLTDDRMVLAVKRAHNHLLHLLLTLITGGLWLPIWALVCVRAATKPYRCPVCGAETWAYPPERRRQ